MLSVVVAGREDDRPPLEALEVARTADRLGYGELWVGESGPTWDSVGPVEAGLGVGSAEHGDLMAEEEELDVLGRGCAGEQCQPAQ
jgi:alkanesulfonate monooxygenase SsuD/methylene tetrahydromethanopterin reductase-like flavin-dependent oxidoreductase (luciferase family)